jgi:hypothetical protein
MPISADPRNDDLAREGYALVDPAAGEITIIAVERHGTLTFDPASPLGWPSAAAAALAAAGWGMRVLEWMPAADGRYAMGVRQVDDAAAADARLQASIDAGRRAGTLIVEQRRPGIHERNGEAAGGGPLAELHAAYTEWHDGGASSNHVDQALDNFLTERGYPTVLYRARPPRGRRR